MPVTPGGLRFPEDSDPVDVPGDLEKLALDIDASVGIMRLLTAQYFA